MVVGHRLDILAADRLARALFGAERFHHPVAGDLSLRYEALTPGGDPDQVLCLHVAEPGSPSERALRLLAGEPAVRAD